MEKKKLNLKKIKVAKLQSSALPNSKLANAKGGGDSNFTTVPIITIGGGIATADTRTSCYSWNGDPENPNCIGS